MRILQYIFCFCSVLCAATAVIAGMLTKSIVIAVCVAAGAVVFGALMYLVKRKLEPPAPKKRDFLCQKKKHKKQHHPPKKKQLFYFSPPPPHMARARLSLAEQSYIILLRARYIII